MSIPAQIDVVFSGEEKFICGLQEETPFSVSLNNEENNRVDVIFSKEETFICGMEDETAFTVSMGEAFLPEEYKGSVDITPTDGVKVLETQGKLLAENIIIEPIPNNYGLITWNGSTLTVS